MGAQICRMANLVNGGEPTQGVTRCHECSRRFLHGSPNNAWFNMSGRGGIGIRVRLRTVSLWDESSSLSVRTNSISVYKLNKCGGNSAGRMSPCQGECRGFESHPPLQNNCSFGIRSEENGATLWKLKFAGMANLENGGEPTQ